MLGHLSVVQVAFHPACVQPDQQAAQLVAQVHVIVSPSVRIGQARPRSVEGDPVRMAVPGGEAYPRLHHGSPKGWWGAQKTGRSVGGRRTGPRGGFHHNPL
ncbi:hypothetical protein GCM10010276_64660 [Streptomyces longisporus]|uniref:Uncharacterized protein n=1 Tax=Streptomyces longisporus TaxID=1948 RepID=A0ABP6A2U1_STRLO